MKLKIILSQLFYSMANKVKQQRTTHVAFRCTTRPSQYPLVKLENRDGNPPHRGANFILSGCLDVIRKNEGDTTKEVKKVTITYPLAGLKKLGHRKGTTLKMIDMMEEEFGFIVDVKETDKDIIFTMDFTDTKIYPNGKIRLTAFSMLRWCLVAYYSNYAECVMHLYHDKKYDIITAFQLATFMMDNWLDSNGNPRAFMHNGPVMYTGRNLLLTYYPFVKLSKAEFLDNASEAIQTSLLERVDSNFIPSNKKLQNTKEYVDAIRNKDYSQKNVFLRDTLNKTTEKIKKDFKAGKENKWLKLYIPHIYEK